MFGGVGGLPMDGFSGVSIAADVFSRGLRNMTVYGRDERAYLPRTNNPVCSVCVPSADSCSTHSFDQSPLHRKLVILCVVGLPEMLMCLHVIEQVDISRG